MKTIRLFLVTLAFLGLSISGVLAQKTDPYIISSVGSILKEFVAGNNSGQIARSSSIQTVIKAIQQDAAGEDCTIQFGDNRTALDIGSSSTSTLITFDGGTIGKDWGLVTLTGKATGSTTGSDHYIISMTNKVSINNKADIVQTGTGPVFINSSTGTLTISRDGSVSSESTTSFAIVNSSTGTINISGGTVQTKTSAIRNFGTGTINISSGTVTTTSAVYAILNSSTGTINISGGTVSAASAVENASGGTITVSGGTITAPSGYAIRNYGTGTININGGTVMSSDGDAIVKFSSGPINITGGKILAKEGYAINNQSSGGMVTASGGLGFAYGTGVTNVINGSFTIPPVNSAILLAWNKAAGHTGYTAGKSNDIFVLPATVTAVWENRDGSGGILATLGSFSDFVPVAGVTVSGSGIAETRGDMAMQIYPNPTSDVLNFCTEAFYQITDLQGRIVQTSGSAVKSANISNLPAGIYFVTLITETGKTVQKVTKE